MLECPRCWHDGPFDVIAELGIKLHSDGKTYDEYNDGLEWNGESYCCCSKCGYEGKLKEFRDAQMS